MKEILKKKGVRRLLVAFIVSALLFANGEVASLAVDDQTNPPVQPEAEMTENLSAQPEAEVTENPPVQPEAEVAENPTAQPEAEVAENPTAQPEAEVTENPPVQPEAGHVHMWSETVREATCTEAGEITYACTVGNCTEKKTASPIPAAGHKDENADGRCEVCGEPMPEEQEPSEALPAFFAAIGKLSELQANDAPADEVLAAYGEAVSLYGNLTDEEKALEEVTAAKEALDTFESVVPLAAGAVVKNSAGTEMSGRCGDGVFYKVTYLTNDPKDGYKLTISGTGPMADYESGQYVPENTKSPWDRLGLSTSIKEIEIEYGVTSIGTHAFYTCRMTSITIPNSVTSINQYAFYWCECLESITISESVTSIGSNAFENCKALATVTFAENSKLKSIGSEAFIQCYALKEIAIPAAVETIDYRAFMDCTGITKLTFAEGSKLNSIGSYAFSSCSMTTVAIPEGTERIEDNAFNNCQKMTTITIPQSVESIGAKAFYQCWSLTGITIPEKVTKIEHSVFYECKSLETITIPQNVTSIGAWAFQWCSNLKTVTFSGQSQLATIGEKAFYACQSIENITIPEKVESIGDAAFGGCRSLDTVHMEGSAPKISSNPNPFEWVFFKAPVQVGFYPQIFVPEIYLETYKTGAWNNEYYKSYISKDVNSLHPEMNDPRFAAQYEAKNWQKETVDEREYHYKWCVICGEERPDVKMGRHENGAGKPYGCTLCNVSDSPILGTAPVLTPVSSNRTGEETATAVFQSTAGEGAAVQYYYKVVDVGETLDAAAIKYGETPATVQADDDGNKKITFAPGDKNAGGTYTPKKICIVAYDGDTPGNVIEMPVPPCVDFGSKKADGTVYTKEVTIPGIQNWKDIGTGIAGSDDKSAFDVVKNANGTPKIEDGKLTVTFKPTEAKTYGKLNGNPTEAVTLTITGKDANGKTVTMTMPLTGSGYNSTTASLTVDAPERFADTPFGSEPPAEQPITIGSTGSAAAQNVKVTVTDTQDAFTVTGLGDGLRGSGVTLAAGSTISDLTIRPKAGLAVGAYTAKITVSYDRGSTIEKTVTFTVTEVGGSNGEKQKEPTPNATIGYVAGKLTGLDANTSYLITVGGETKTVPADNKGEILIENNWFGKTLSIVKPARNDGCENSDAQSLPIPTRPAAPAVQIANTSSAGANDGKIAGVSTAMEYRKVGETSWKPCTGTEITGLPTGSYEVRVKAKDTAGSVKGNFYGNTKTVSVGSTVPPAPPAPQPPVHEHNYTQTKAPTCTTAGEEKCSSCGDTKTIPDLGGHSWNEGAIKTVPTCETAGVKTITCTKCGETKTEAIPAIGHKWNGGTVTKAPTQTEEGVKTYTCQNNPAHKKTETVAKLTEDKKQTDIPKTDTTTTITDITKTDTTMTDTAAQEAKPSSYPVVQDAEQISDLQYEYPAYQSVTPDPNDSKSPEIIIVLNEDGVPLAYRKVQDPENPENMIYMEDASIPLAGPSMKDKTGGWALLNLIMTIVSVFGGVYALLRYFTKKRREEDEEAAVDADREEEKKKRRKWYILSAASAIASVIAFILTENMRLPMVFIDRFTFLMIVLALMQAPGVLARLSKKV